MFYSKKNRILAVLVFFILIVVGTCLIPHETIGYNYADSSLVFYHSVSKGLTSETDYSFTVSLNGLSCCELIDLPGSFSDTDTVETSQSLYGTASTDEYKDAHLMICRKADEAILLCDADGAYYLVSIESNETTEGIFSALTEFLKES